MLKMLRFGWLASTAERTCILYRYHTVLIMLQVERDEIVRDSKVSLVQNESNVETTLFLSSMGLDIRIPRSIVGASFRL